MVVIGLQFSVACCLLVLVLVVVVVVVAGGWLSAGWVVLGLGFGL